MCVCVCLAKEEEKQAFENIGMWNVNANISKWWSQLIILCFANFFLSSVDFFFNFQFISLFFFVNEIKKYCFAIFVELKQWQFALEDVEKFPIQPISDSKINSNVCSLVGFWQVVQAKNF